LSISDRCAQANLQSPVAFKGPTNCLPRNSLAYRCACEGSFSVTCLIGDTRAAVEKEPRLSQTTALNELNIALERVEQAGSVSLAKALILGARLYLGASFIIRRYPLNPF
jgi:hypothetical protein